MFTQRIKISELTFTGYQWDPYEPNDFQNDPSKANFSKLLEDLDLKDNYFSIRGELVFVTLKKEFVARSVVI